jgi:uncharacterized membrane protein
LFWLAMIGGLVLLFRHRRWDHSHPGSEEAMLAERFARGEITEQGYRERVAVLRERSR